MKTGLFAAPSTAHPPVLQDIRSLIDAARTRAAARVNAESPFSAHCAEN